MIDWIKSSIHERPNEVGNILLFSTLTGLRPEEAQEAIYPIKTKGVEYVNNEKGLPLHYLFPKTIFRTTKKCYISVINKGILDFEIY